jgi:hypothetical protein
MANPQLKDRAARLLRSLLPPKPWRRGASWNRQRYNPQASYSEFVAGLLRAQWHDRQESALEWRIRRANLPERW